MQQDMDSGASGPMMPDAAVEVAEGAAPTESVPESSAPAKRQIRNKVWTKETPRPFPLRGFAVVTGGTSRRVAHGARVNVVLYYSCKGIPYVKVMTEDGNYASVRPENLAPVAEEAPVQS